MSNADRRIAVLETLHRLQAAIDQRDWDVVTNTFLPDATGYGAVGVKSILAQMHAHLDGCGATQHLLGNEIVEFDGPEALIHAYARVYHAGAGVKAGAFFECMGEYTDRWIEIEGQWRLKKRWFEIRIMLGDFEVLRPTTGPR